jgi:hypothetical protein
MRAACVEGDIAADGANRLARRIRSVMQTVRLSRRRHGEIHDSRLHDRNPLLWIEPQDSIQPVQRDHNSACKRQ